MGHIHPLTPSSSPRLIDQLRIHMRNNLYGHKAE